MTNAEAIEMLTSLRVWGDDLKIAKKMACDALEKQIPKKPNKEYYDFYCPCCGNNVGCYEYADNLITDSFCSDCGQAIDWSDEK